MYKIVKLIIKILLKMNIQIKMLKSLFKIITFRKMICYKQMLQR